jgi:hypothetical protein
VLTLFCEADLDSILCPQKTSLSDMTSRSSVGLASAHVVSLASAVALTVKHRCCLRIPQLKFLRFMFFFQAIDESLRLLSRQFAVTKLELEAEKAAYLAEKLGTASDAFLSHTELVEETNKLSAEAMNAVNSPQELSESNTSNYATISPDAVIEKLFPIAPEPLRQTVSEPRFNFNPSLLLARDRWSQAWTGFMRPAAAEPVRPAEAAADVTAAAAADVTATAAAADALAAASSTAANLSENLKSMQVEKPLRWIKPKPKVVVSFYCCDTDYKFTTYILACLPTKKSTEHSLKTCKPFITGIY